MQKLLNHPPSSVAAVVPFCSKIGCFVRLWAYLVHKMVKKYPRRISNVRRCRYKGLFWFRMGLRIFFCCLLYFCLRLDQPDMEFLLSVITNRFVSRCQLSIESSRLYCNISRLPPDNGSARRLNTNMMTSFAGSRLWYKFFRTNLEHIHV